MCDLWPYTTVDRHAAGAIPAQVAAARTMLQSRDEAGPRGMKLYNAGSFFDPRAVPEADYDGVAAALAGLSRVIVESHPALVGPRVDRLLGVARAPSRIDATDRAAARSRDGARDGASRQRSIA